MNRFVIVDGLPYLFANGKTFAVRWDEKGFTVGMEVELASIPSSPITYSELSIKAKCAGRLNSIDMPDQTEEIRDDQEEPNQPEEIQDKPEAPDLDSMTIAQLKAFAEAQGIDLGKASKKAEILAVIKGREDA